MKSLILVAIVLIASAGAKVRAAEPLAYVENKQGGRIEFFLLPASPDIVALVPQCERKMMARSYGNEVKTMVGCWSAKGEDAEVYWVQPEQWRRYPLDKLTFPTYRRQGM